jgi:hypothetical protein
LVVLKVCAGRYSAGRTREGRSSGVGKAMG